MFDPVIVPYLIKLIYYYKTINNIRNQSFAIEYFKHRNTFDEKLWWETDNDKGFTHSGKILAA